MNVHLNRKELELLKALDREYPGGVERTKELFQDATALEELGFADSASVSYRKSAVWITENGRQYLRDKKSEQVLAPDESGRRYRHLDFDSGSGESDLGLCITSSFRVKTSQSTRKGPRGKIARFYVGSWGNTIFRSCLFSKS